MYNILHKHKNLKKGGIMKKKFSILLTIGLLYSSLGTVQAQKMAVKDTDGNVLMEVIDEGKIGSITLPDTAARIHVETNRLYNYDGTLIWNGSALGTSGSAGGWTVDTDTVSLTSNDNLVGIGTDNPEFKLTVDNDGGIIAKGTYNSGKILTTSGEGARLIWYPRKAAFRAGFIQDYYGTFWDDDSIGSFSVAFGYNTRARGEYSFASGEYTRADGSTSTAMGYSTQAIGIESTAMGYHTTASGWASTAMGNGTKARDDYSTAMGYHTTASGDASTAMGSYVSTSGDGSFIIGDYSSSTVLAKTTANHFWARFANGYHLYTNSAATLGVTLNANGTSWSSVSDSTKKENFKPVNGEEVLNKISDFKLGTWNYIGQDPAKYRHYGPMAQDFYAAFGLDGIGVVGNDTTLASADVDGINFIAVQALEKRTSELRDEVAKLHQANEQVLVENRKLQDGLNQLKSLLADLINEEKKSELQMTSVR